MLALLLIQVSAQRCQVSDEVPMIIPGKQKINVRKAPGVLEGSVQEQGQEQG